MICKTAKYANDYVCGWLTRQPELKEESITDWLLDYFDQHSNQIKYYQFNRHKEGRYSGADWDWWFLLKNGCFKMRIQAKKLKSNTNHYSELVKSNKKGLQIDLLLSSSSLQNFYPLYAFYGKAEGVEKCQNKSTPAFLHISSAQDVYDVVFNRLKQRINSTDLLKLTIPLECLFCCPLVRDFSDKGPIRLFENYFNVSPRNIGNDNKEGDSSESRGFEEKTPQIITSLYNLETINDDTLRLINEYRNQYPGSNSLAIVKIDKDIDTI